MNQDLERFRSDYHGIPALGLATDIQGWHHEEPIFEQLVDQLKPKVYAEVGCFKGASLIRVAQMMKRLWGSDAQCFAVDYWRGFGAGLYSLFLHNVIASGVQDVVIPVRMDSLSAARILEVLGVRPQLVYIDADHTFTSCRNDIQAYLPLLAPGGVMFGDDYTEEKEVGLAVRSCGIPFTNTYYHWQFEPKK